MTKQQLIDELYTHNTQNLSKKELAETLAALATVATEALKAGDHVDIPGLVRLKVGERAARPGRNPQTGETIQLAAKKVIKASISKPLADAVA